MSGWSCRILALALLGACAGIPAMVHGDAQAAPRSATASAGTLPWLGKPKRTTPVPERKPLAAASAAKTQKQASAAQEPPASGPAGPGQPSTTLYAEAAHAGVTLTAFASDTQEAAATQPPAVKTEAEAKPAQAPAEISAAPVPPAQTASEATIRTASLMTPPAPERKPAGPRGTPSIPLEVSSPNAGDSEAPVKVATDKVKLQQCLALKKCRSGYTRCFNRLEKEVKPENWTPEREKCVVTYKACMEKNFQGSGMFFTRYFVPDEDCTQYR